MSFENVQSNEIFDLLINSYKISEGFDEEPMDGDATEQMANKYAIERGWNEAEKRKFLNYANIREGNTNSQDFDINLNEMKENKERDRMIKLTQSFNQKGEIFKEDREPTNSEKINEEFKRLSELASGEKTKAVQESLYGTASSSQSGAGYHGVNQGRSVTSIVDNMYSNPNQYQGAKGNNIALKDNEGLEISIKRTLESGAPVNNIAFYDEVNWNLAQLGFPSKLPQDIKEAILKMIS